MSRNLFTKQFSTLSIPVRLTLALALALVALGVMIATITWAQPGNPDPDPDPNTHTAPLTTTVSITYDEPISASTVTSHTFAVHAMQSGLVTSTHGVVNGGYTIIVTPTNSFHQGELVYVIATTRTLNITGTEPVSATQWQFNAGQVFSRCVSGFITDTAASANLIGVYFSSVAWGDYDNDGDLDILLTGEDNGGGDNALVYENVSGVFITDTTASANLTGVAYSSVAWGDYDNDGDLDILLTGWSGGVNALVYENQAGVFITDTTASANLTGVFDGSVAWGDYDNDGDLDILLTGYDSGGGRNALVYQNQAGVFVTDATASANLTGVLISSVAWGDYDNDSDLDILLTGWDGSAPRALVYQNQAGVFVTDTTASANLVGVYESSVAWGDYDNDGDLDILLTGYDSGSAPRALVYENQGGVFVTDTVASQNLVGVYFSSVAWGDYDNDGDLDILLTGEDNGGGDNALVYENVSGVFITDTTASANLTGVAYSSVAWGDYDNDSDLDILLTGYGGGYNALVYRNDDCSPPDLTVSKYADPEPAVAGETLTYIIIITNQGNLTATHVTISDTLPPSATLQIIDQTDDDDDLLGFGGGIYQDTRWNDSRPYYEWLELSSPAITSTGVFTSRIIDASNVVTWTGLEWRPRRPIYKPLPDNGGSDQDYSLGEANMMANRLLLHLDEVSGTTTFADTSGHALPATCPAIISDTCPTAGAAGRFNGALAFDGALNQTVVVTDSLDPARYAIEMWVYPTVVTNTSFILRTDAPTDTAENYSHLLGIYDGHFMHAVYAGGYRFITSTTLVVTDTWYHLVGTAQSGGDIKLFVNGVQETKLDGIGTLWTGGDWYRLGSSYGPTGTSQYFSGRLDEVAVYSRTLSAGEVNDHYLRGALRLSFQVRTCDDAACAGESFGAETCSEQTNTGAGLPTVTFSPTLPNNRYFQYRATFETDQPDYSPELRRVRVWPDHRALFASQGSCDASASAFTCDLGDLPGGGPSEDSGQSVITVTALVNINPSALGIITNTASVSATNDITLTNNTAFVTSTVGSEVNLSVYKYDTWHDGTDPVNPGFPMTYTLEVHNGGPSTAWDVTVTDTLPITITGVSAPSGWTVEYTSRTVTCTTPSLLPYTWPDIIISGLAPTVEGVITNTSWVTAAASSVYTTSHISDTETTVIEFLADLSITKIAAPDPVGPGAILTYTITVTNAGPSPAYGVIVTDTMGTPGLINYPISNSDWLCGPPGTVVACVYNHLFLGAMQSASFNVTTTAPFSGLIANTAVVMALTTDPVLEDNIAFAYAAVRPVADLFITKADVKDPVDAAAPLTYTLTVTNTGYVQAGARVAHLTLTNGNNIYIPTGGRAMPYPSYVYLASAEGTIRDITVTLHNLNHTYPGDLDLLLVGPNGQSIVLMANAGGGYDATDVTLTLHDGGAAMPLSGTLTSTVVYRSTNYGVGGDDGNFPDPAPDGPYGGNLSAFHNADPNGAWQLWVYDNVASDGGSIAGGWSLALTTLTTDTVTLTDTLPAGLTGPINVTEPPDWDCGFAGSEMTCQADTFPVNAPLVFTITATAPITGGVITNTAGIASTTADYGPHRNTHTITTTITPVANLAITKTVTPDPVSADGPLTYTLAVNNAGPSPVFVTVTVTDALPAELTDVSASGSGWTCDLAALPALTCTTGSLALGPAPSMYIFATAPVTPGVITNTAAVTTSVADLDLLDNSTVVTTTIIRRSDLLIIKSAQPEGVTPNSALTFTLSITNAGPSEAINITVTDVLTNYGAVGSPAGAGWSCNQTGGAFTCTTGSLAVGATSIVFTATAPAAGGVMTNTATVTSSVEDLVPANNSHTIFVNVSLPPTISIPLSDYDTDEDTSTRGRKSFPG